MKKVILTIIIALSVIMSISAHDLEINGIFYNNYGSTLEVTYKGTKYNSYENEYIGDIRIPYSITNYFGDHKTSVVTSIDEYAFYDCSGLTSITIPNSLTSIGDWAFSGCDGLTAIAIPNSVTTIGNGAFNYCTSLKTITIPESVNKIEAFAFWQCHGLTSLVVSKENNIYDSRDNCNAIIETATNTLIQGCEVTKIPNSVTTIGKGAFRNCRFTSFAIPDNVKSIGYEAFMSSDLVSVIIPNSVFEIGESAFYDCSELESILIGDSVKEIGSYAFNKCENLNSIVIPNSVTTIGRGAFNSCTSLDSVIIGNSVKSIGDVAFHNCNKLKYLKFGNFISSIGTDVFDALNNIETVDITDLSAWSKIDLESSPFTYLNQPILKVNGQETKELVIPNGVYEIKKSVFREINTISSVIIPNSVEKIGEDAFYGCDMLNSIFIGNSVKSIGAGAFGGSWLLGSVPEYINKVVVLNPTPPECEDEVFYEDIYSSATLYVPKDSFSRYFIHDVWGKFTNIKKIEILTTKIDLNELEIELNRGGSRALSATISPSNTTLTDLSWESSDVTVAVVDQNGLIKALHPGNTTITVRALDGSEVVAICNVIVKGARIKLSHTEVSLPVNDIMTLSYTVDPNDVSVEWSTSDSEVAYIKDNADGSVTVVGMADGIANITARVLDGSDASAICVVKVGEAGIEDVKVDNNAVEVFRYDINGRLLNRPAKGINIVKMSDGTTRKEYVKNE